MVGLARVVSRLNLSCGSIYKLAGTGLLPQPEHRGRGRYFYEKDVAAFSEQFILHGKLARNLRVSCTKLSKIARDQGLHPVAVVQNKNGVDQTLYRKADTLGLTTSLARRSDSDGSSRDVSI